MILTNLDTTLFKYHAKATGSVQSGDLNYVRIPMSYTMLGQGEKNRFTQHANLKYVDNHTSLRYNFRFGFSFYPKYYQKIFPELRTFYSSSTVSGIKHKLTYGGGFGGYLIKGTKHTIQFTNGVIRKNYVFETIAKHNDTRYYLICQGLWNAFDNRMELLYRYTAQYAFEKHHHYLHRMMISFGVPITKKISCNFDMDYMYSSLVDTNKANANLSTSFGLSIKN